MPLTVVLLYPNRKGVVVKMRSLPRRLLLSALGWSLQRDARGATVAIIATIVCAIAGYYAGRSGFGSWYLGLHDARMVKFWHEALAPIGAAAFVALWRANGIARRWLRSDGVNPTVISLFCLPMYLTIVLVIFAAWSFWTLPVWFAWQVFALLLCLVRPFTRRAIAELEAASTPAPPVPPAPADSVLETATAIARAAQTRLTSE